MNPTTLSPARAPHRRAIVALTIAAAISATAPLAAEDGKHRQLDAHVHGQGTLNIAIEDQKVELELEAPGADIAGFESHAETAEQKAAIEKGKALLSDGRALFVWPEAAGCTLDKTEVSVEAGEQDANDDTAGKHDGHDHHGKAKDKEEHGGHSEFHAHYHMTCKNPAALTQLETRYFATFAAAKALTVNIVGSKGQSQMQLTREKPLIALTGVM